MTALRNVLQRAALMLLSIVISLIVLEIGFRLYRWHGLHPPPREDDPVYHHRLKPFDAFHQHSPDFETSVTTNNLGLRGPTNYGPKPAGVRRLLVMGDSFTFGVGVSDGETSCDLMQRALAQQGTAIQVVNAGLGGYSPLLHYLALRGLYLPLEPDAVVLWFDFGDLQDDFFYERNLRYDAAGGLLGCDPNYVNGRFDWAFYLRERSALAKYLYNQLIRTSQRMRILGVRRYLLARLRGESAKGLIANLQGDERSRVDPLNYDQLMMVRGRALLGEIRAHWQRTGKYILMIRDLLRERNIPFALAAYPYGIQVGPDQWGSGRAAFGFKPGATYDDPFAFEVLEEFCRDHGILFLNSYPAFVAHRDQRLFHDWDGHFTAAGQRVVADYLLHDPQFAAFIQPLRRTAK